MFSFSVFFHSPKKYFIPLQISSFFPFSPKKKFPSTHLQQFFLLHYYCLLFLRGSNNQNGNLKWILPIGVGPPPPLPTLNSKNFQIFFTPLFSFAIESYIYETDFTLGLIKISLLSPLMIGSKLSFSGCCNRRLPYDSHVQFIVTLTNTYIPNIKLKLMCKARFGSQRPELLMNVNFEPIIRGLKSDIFEV